LRQGRNALTSFVHRRAQDGQITDVVCQQQDQFGVHKLALLRREKPMNVYKRFIEFVWGGNVKFSV